MIQISNPLQTNINTHKIRIIYTVLQNVNQLSTQPTTWTTPTFSKDIFWTQDHQERKFDKSNFIETKQSSSKTGR